MNKRAALSEEKTIDIRPAKVSEAPRLVELQEGARNSAWSVEAWRRELNRDHSAVWVADEDGPVALLAMWRIFDRIEIVDVVVDVQYRRQNIAEAMLETAIAVAQIGGVQNIALEVREKNRAAISLYRKLGFESVDRRTGFYDGKDQTAIVMVRPVRRDCSKP